MGENGFRKFIAGGFKGAGEKDREPAGGDIGEKVFLVGVRGESRGVLARLPPSSRQWIPESGLMALLRGAEPKNRGRSTLDDLPDLGVFALLVLAGVEDLFCGPGVVLQPPWLKPNGEGDCEWMDLGEVSCGVGGFEYGVVLRELLRDTRLAAACNSASFLQRPEFTQILSSSPSTLPSLSPPDSHSISPLVWILPFLWPGMLTALAGLFPFMDKCREQNPRLWDSLLQPSFAQSRLHCFPLNFFLMPVSVVTISPFLYFCWVGVGVREELAFLGFGLCSFRGLVSFIPCMCSSSSEMALSVFSSSFKLLLYDCSLNDNCLAPLMLLWFPKSHGSMSPHGNFRGDPLSSSCCFRLFGDLGITSAVYLGETNDGAMPSGQFSWFSFELSRLLSRSSLESDEQFLTSLSTGRVLITRSPSATGRSVPFGTADFAMRLLSVRRFMPSREECWNRNKGQQKLITSSWKKKKAQDEVLSYFPSSRNYGTRTVMKNWLEILVAKPICSVSDLTLSSRENSKPTSVCRSSPQPELITAAAGDIHKT